MSLFSFCLHGRLRARQYILNILIFNIEHVAIYSELSGSFAQKVSQIIFAKTERESVLRQTRDLNERIICFPIISLRLYRTKF